MCSHPLSLTLSTVTPSCVMFCAVAWRYFAFHPLGELLLLADSSLAFSTPEEFASASVIGYPRPSLKLVILDIADVTQKAKSQSNATDADEDGAPAALTSASASPSAVQGKQELRVLATVDRLLFFSDSGVALHDSKLATCQWNLPSDLSGTTSAGLSALVPSLVIFSLHPSSLGVPLVRVALDLSSFADLTCLCFTDESAEFLAVAFQVSRGRRERRERIKHMQRLQEAMWPTRETGAQVASSAMPVASAADAPPAGAFPPPRRLRAGRSSALSRLTESENFVASAAPVASAGSQPTQAVPSSTRLRASSLPLDELLEDRTFLTVHRCSDLLRVQQYCAPWSEVAPRGGAGSSVLSSNVLLSHPCRSVGLLAGATNGDIHVFSPVATDPPTATQPAPLCGSSGGAAHIPATSLHAALANGHSHEEGAHPTARLCVVPLRGRHCLPSDLR